MVGVGEGLSDGEETGDGERDGVVCGEAVGAELLFAFLITPLTQTNFFPTLTHVKDFPTDFAIFH
jgi:hypothetical protein